MQVIILAGGLGTRLKSVVSDIPKPMAQVGEYPFLYYLLRWISNFSISKFVFATGYKSEIIESYFGSSYMDIPIAYAIEKEPMGTGGGIMNALKMTNDDNLLIINGDTYFPISLDLFLALHMQSDAKISIALKYMENFERYGSVSINEKNEILQFHEKQPQNRGLINGGIYLLKRSTFDKYNIQKKFSFETEILEKEVGEGKLKGFIFPETFLDIGVPEDYLKSFKYFDMNKALFLDRDGVINQEYNYVYKIEDFDFIPGIFNLCKSYQDQGYLIFIITNQAGIARGFYSEQDFNILTDWMIKQFDIQSITINKVYFCPHHPEITGSCECRKPNPGMILRATQEFDIDLKSSILIGDKESDLQAGRNAGIPRNYYIGELLTKR